MKHSSVALCLLATILSAPMWTDATVHATDWVVSNTSDSDAGMPPVAGSLRLALASARNGDSVLFDPVVFDLVNSDANTTINVTSELPPLDYGNVTIDSSNRRVSVNGSGTNSARGLVISSSNNVIRGLTLVGFPGSGIAITSGTNNLIGGSRSTGTGPNGQGLRIANCGAFGIEITGVGTTGNTVKGCWIGLDASGTSAAQNLAGVMIQGGSSGNTIGSAVLSEGNVIGGNLFEGTTFSGTGTDDNVVIGNTIGEGAGPGFPNGGSGILVTDGAQGTHIGGDNPGEGNNVAFNGGNGVEVRSATARRNSARGNRVTANSRGGIALFDGSNDGVKAPEITKVEEAPPDGSGVRKYRVLGTTHVAGSVEIFNDSGDQGGTLLGRGAVAGGAFAVDVDYVLVTNLTATLTDALGNTSEFGVFGLTTVDTDDDGVADVLETLAGTNPNDPIDTPDIAGALSLDKAKLSIKLNFTNAGKDSIIVKPSVSLPPAAPLAGLNVGIYVAGHSGQLALDAKGKAKSPDGTLAIQLKTEKTGATTVKITVKKSSLQADVAPFGLTNRTTPKGGDAVVLPLAVTIGSSTGKSVYFGAATLSYTAKAGKTGSAKQANPR